MMDSPAQALVKAHRAALEKSHLRAFIHLEALGAPRAGSATIKGPLTGVPFAVKDNIAVMGQPLSCGATLLTGYVPPEDAFVVEALRQAGATPLGKTNLDAFAMGSTTEHSAFGATLNPWGGRFSPGGSSGGSAAAVGAGIVPFALGSDTGGSVRQPAAHCGVVGFKPSYGAYSRRGLVAFASSLDHIGVFANSVAEVAFLHPILAQKDPGDSTSLGDQRPIPSPPPLKGLRFAFPRTLGGVDSEVDAAFALTLEHLRRKGAQCVPVAFPGADDTLGTYHVLASAEAASNLARFDGVRYGARAIAKGLDFSQLITRSRQEGLGEEVKRRILLGTLILEQGRGAAYYRRALLNRRRIGEALNRALTDTHALLTPTTPNPPFPLGAALADPIATYQGDRFTAPMNLGGLPAISIPMGWTETGLPLGLQIATSIGDDARLLALAQAIESTLAPQVTNRGAHDD